MPYHQTEARLDKAKAFEALRRELGCDPDPTSKNQRADVAVALWAETERSWIFFIKSTKEGEMLVGIRAPFVVSKSSGGVGNIESAQLEFAETPTVFQRLLLWHCRRYIY